MKDQLIGKSKIVSNIEIAQFDFSEKLYWNDSKAKASMNFGDKSLKIGGKKFPNILLTLGHQKKIRF